MKRPPWKPAFQSLPPKYFSIMKIDAFNRKNTPPVLYLIKKLKENK